MSVIFLIIKNKQSHVGQMQAQYRYLRKTIKKTDWDLENMRLWGFCFITLQKIKLGRMLLFLQPGS